jgi:hypothetical protein
MAAGTLPSVGTARSVGRRTQHFLFIYYGNKAICALRASVGSTNGTSLRAREGLHPDEVSAAPGWTLPRIMEEGGDSRSCGPCQDWTPLRRLPVSRHFH